MNTPLFGILIIFGWVCFWGWLANRMGKHCPGEPPVDGEEIRPLDKVIGIGLLAVTITAVAGVLWKLLG